MAWWHEKDTKKKLLDIMTRLHKSEKLAWETLHQVRAKMHDLRYLANHNNSMLMQCYSPDSDSEGSNSNLNEDDNIEIEEVALAQEQPVEEICSQRRSHSTNSQKESNRRSSCSQKESNRRSSGSQKESSIKSYSQKEGSIKSYSQKEGSIKSYSQKEGSIKSNSQKESSIKSNSQKEGSIKSNSQKESSIRSSYEKDSNKRSSSQQGSNRRSCGSQKEGSIKSYSQKESSIRSSYKKLSDDKSSYLKSGNELLDNQIDGMDQCSMKKTWDLVAYHMDRISFHCECFVNNLPAEQLTHADKLHCQRFHQGCNFCTVHSKGSSASRKSKRCSDEKFI